MSSLSTTLQTSTAPRQLMRRCCACRPIASASSSGSVPTAPPASTGRWQRRWATSQTSHGLGSSISSGPSWRPLSALDEWVAREARPVSLRQLMFFGRSLTEQRLISSANYVRTELPTRLSHRIRDMQLLPYLVVSNKNIAEVYDMYWHAFDTFRRVKEIKSQEDNDAFCKTISQMLKTHLTVIPKLAMGVLESSGLMDPEELNKFMNRILQSRISRRVIAEQHLALTEGFRESRFSPNSAANDSEFVGNVLVKCVARDVVERCGTAVQQLARSAYGPDVPVPDIKIDGHLSASFPFILSHLEYIIGELLRNSIQAVIERQASMAAPAPSHQPHSPQQQQNTYPETKPSPIEVTICESPQHVMIRVSDQGGGIPRGMLPYLWSFSKGPHSERLLANLERVPKLAATLQEVRVENDGQHQQPPLEETSDEEQTTRQGGHKSSLSSLSSRPPNLRLGIGLPLSRVYAEYWAGSLELHSLEGYGVDVFLQISKLGNKNEQLTTRASMDAL